MNIFTFITNRICKNCMHTLSPSCFVRLYQYNIPCTKSTFPYKSKRAGRKTCSFVPVGCEKYEIRI